MLKTQELLCNGNLSSAESIGTTYRSTLHVKLPLQAENFLMWTDTLPKKRMRKHACNSLSKFILFLHTGIYEGVGVSQEITDMTEILQYTMNSAAGMWTEQRRVRKTTCAVLNKFISPYPLKEVNQNSKLVMYDNIFCHD